MSEFIKVTTGQTPKPIRCYDLEGNMLQDYESLRSAAKATQVKEAMVSSCVNFKSNFGGCFQFRFLKTTTPEKIGNVLDIFNGGRERTPVAKYWNGKLICVYNSISDASEKNNLPHGHISQFLSGKGKDIKGFTFKFI